MNKNYIILAVAVIIIIMAFLYYSNSNQKNPVEEINNEQQAVTENENENENNEMESEEVIVRYTAGGYEPNELNVEAETTVTFVNESSGLMWTATDSHPTHLELPGFDASLGLGIGQKYSYTFTEVGTWDYHDHLKPQFTGRVIVR